MVKTEEFDKEDGTTGTSFKLEDGDKVVSRFSVPVKSDGTKFENYSLGVTMQDGSDIYLRLTKAQYEGLLQYGDLTGKTIVGRSYTNKFGKQVGVKVENPEIVPKFKKK